MVRYPRMIKAVGVLAAATLAASTALPEASSSAATPAARAKESSAAASTALPEASSAAGSATLSEASSAVAASATLFGTSSAAASATLSKASSAEAPAAISQSCGRSLNLVAHEDDDLLFINPAVSDDIAAGRCVVTLFVTAGDSGRARNYWHGRELGSMAAYAAMARVRNAWLEDKFTVAGHTLARVQLIHTKITLFFLRLPDAHGNAQRPPETLQLLWRDQIGTMHTLDKGDVYTRRSLIDVLTGIMNVYQPDDIRTLDYAGRYGDGDHADHHTVGYLTYAAQRDYRSPHRLSGYMGYKVDGQPRNLTDDVRDTKLGYFLAYAPFDRKVCQSSKACLANFYAPRFSHSIQTGSQAGGGRNVAPEAQARASSANMAAQQQPAKAIDGSIRGAPAAASNEWATAGRGAGSWIELAWNSPQPLDEINLYDRPNPLDQVTGGTLQFSDGSAIRVGPLPSNGTPKVVHFSPRTVTALRFTVTAVSRTTRSIGLAEIRAYAVGS